MLVLWHYLYFVVNISDFFIFLLTAILLLIYSYFVFFSVFLQHVTVDYRTLHMLNVDIAVIM